MRWIVFILLVAATPHDRQTIRAKWKSAFNDNMEVNVDMLGQERLIVNTNKVYWRWVVSLPHLRDNMNVDLSNITKAKFDEWKDANLDNPQQFQILVADDWRQALTDAGLEPVPTGD